MRGEASQQAEMLVPMTPDSFVPADHPHPGDQGDRRRRAARTVTGMRDGLSMLELNTTESDAIETHY
ncbi:MAG: hypothetical protein EPO22_14255 [Dehalococcoidia bacterium]|nr:MAG: hypothetical protein EPO22_14255 [Dehalococcoidia bacterium]